MPSEIAPRALLQEMEPVALHDEAVALLQFFRLGQVIAWVHYHRQYRINQRREDLRIQEVMPVSDRPLSDPDAHLVFGICVGFLIGIVFAVIARGM